MSWQHSAWPKDKHDEILDLIRVAYGGDLPDWAIAADLVFHADAANHPTRPVPFPGRRKLEERWNVSEYAARGHLSDPGWQEKCDQLRIPRPTRHLKGRNASEITPSATPSATKEAEQPTEFHPVEHPLVTPSTATRALIPPVPPVPPLLLSEEREARAPPLAPLSAPSASPRSKRATKLDEDYDRVCDYFVEKFAPATGISRPSRPDRATDRGRLLLGECRKDVDRLLDALRWVAEGPDPFHRDRKCSLRSAIKFVDEYADRWRSEKDHPSAKPYVRGDHPGVPEPTPAEREAIYLKLGMDPHNPVF